MTVSQLLSALEVRGVSLVRDEDRLVCVGTGPPLPADLLEELRCHKNEVLSLLKCGRCGTPLAGPVNKWWRVLLDSGPIYLCSASCVHQAWPWRMEVGHDHNR
jgi:hypothetical protein